MAEEKRNLLGPYIPEGSFIRETIQQAKLIYNLMLDQRVPALSKLIPLASLAYLFFPVDVIPDLFVGLGQLDDLAIVMLGLRFFLELAPADVVREHLKRLAQAGHWSVADNQPSSENKAEDVIDGTYRSEN